MAGNRILSLNVNHSRYLGGLMDTIASEEPSIICLQEVIQDTDELTMLVRGKGYKASVSPGPNNKPGIAILYKEGVTTAMLAGQIMRLDTGKLTVYKIWTIWQPKPRSQERFLRNYPAWPPSTRSKVTNPHWRLELHNQKPRYRKQSPTKNLTRIEAATATV